MTRKVQYRLVIILVILVAAGYFFIPPQDKSDPTGAKDKIKLGLDLKGGIHLVVQVQTEDAIAAEINQKADAIETMLVERSVPFESIQRNPESVEVRGIPQEREAEVKSQVSETFADGYDIRSIPGATGAANFTLALRPRVNRELRVQSVNQALETLRGRVDALGVAEYTIQPYSGGGSDIEDQIIIELPGVADPGRAMEILKKTAQLELKIVHPQLGGPYPSREAAAQAFSGTVPSDYEVLPYRERPAPGAATPTGPQFLVVRRAASITGRHLKDARPSQDEYGRPSVSFFLNPEGVSIFSNVTRQNVNNRLAIVLDGEVKSAPNIIQEIRDETAQITGSFSTQETADLSLVLRTGALPARIKILSSQIVGPSLGADSIRQGMLASLVGLVLVIIGMVAIYRFSGVNAIVCLVVNLIILLGFMGAVEATLTLPGIAGLILTIGMAVDTNVLIFERIKEEMAAGKTVRAAVDAGFSKVFLTIIDTHLTTLVSALFLFWFGTGPIRGFAVTLSAGLIANVWTAMFISRTLYQWILSNPKRSTISI